MSISNRFFVQSTVALLVVGFLALVGIVGMTFWLGERAQVYFNEVIESRDARASAVDLRNAVQTAESSQRGFLVTGNEVYLAPYDAAKDLAKRQLDTLDGAPAARLGASPSVRRLRVLLAEKFNEMDQTIVLKRNRQDADALALVRTNRGKALMDEANVFFSGIIRVADERLTTGLGEQRANAIWLRWFSIVGGFIIVAVVGGAAITVFRYTRELGHARDEVGILNAGLETRVKDRTADLARANEEIQRFVHIITHDLRAPLVNIVGFTSELEGSVKTFQALLERQVVISSDDEVVENARVAARTDVPEAIGFIRSSTTKMSNLISAILRLSREGGRTLRPEPVQLDALIASSSATIQHQLTQAGGQMAIDLAVPSIVSDRLSLELIVGNLLDNAVKYSAKQRPLRIDVRTRNDADDRVILEVSDNGRGIAEQDRQRVFELFKRAGEQDQPGEGIGLAYVLKSVRNIGGDISVTSTLGEGTTFRVVLPRSIQLSAGSGTNRSDANDTAASIG